MVSQTVSVGEIAELLRQTRDNVAIVFPRCKGKVAILEELALRLLGFETATPSDPQHLVIIVQYEEDKDNYKDPRILRCATVVTNRDFRQRYAEDPEAYDDALLLFDDVCFLKTDRFFRTLPQQKVWAVTDISYIPSESRPCRKFGLQLCIKALEPSAGEKPEPRDVLAAVLAAFDRKILAEHPHIDKQDWPTCNFPTLWHLAGGLGGGRLEGYPSEETLTSHATAVGATVDELLHLHNDVCTCSANRNTAEQTDQELLKRNVFEEALAAPGLHPHQRKLMERIYNAL